VPPRVQYWRSAVIGSTLDARTAGRDAALSATNSNSPVATADVRGSCGATPYSRLSINRVFVTDDGVGRVRSIVGRGEQSADRGANAQDLKEST
jgi:hypothetical protein